MGLKFLFLEPFYGGSHRDFADGLKTFSRHDIDLVTLPDRFWKWRMRGAALYFAKKIQEPDRYDGLIVTSMMSLADLQALWGGRCPPALVYFHENQLNYPLSDGESPDYQFGFTNITTALAARRILFNSRKHQQTFLAALPKFIKMMPDHRPNWAIRAIADKAAVACPGCHFSPDATISEAVKKDPPLIIWNHRWEHDKNPEPFFDALTILQQRGMAFRLALLGERYGRCPPVFEDAPTRFRRELVQYGYVAGRADYYQWLQRGAIAISTALQENFGIAVVEAMRFGCLPLVPDRLSYPEIIPESLHADFLYADQNDLIEKLIHLINTMAGQRHKRKLLAAAMQPYAWQTAIERFDWEFSQLAGREKENMAYRESTKISK